MITLEEYAIKSKRIVEINKKQNKTKEDYNEIKELLAELREYDKYNRKKLNFFAVFNNKNKKEKK